MKNIKHTVVFGAFLVIGLLTAMWQIEGRAHAQGEVLSTATATPRPGSQLFDAIPTSTPVRPKIVSVIPRSPMVGDSVTVSGIAEKGGLIGIYIDEEVVKTTTASTSQAWMVEITFDQPGEYEIRARLITNSKTISDFYPATVKVAVPPTTTPGPTVATPTVAPTKSVPVPAGTPTSATVPPPTPSPEPTSEPISTLQPESPLPPDMAVTLLEPSEGQALEGKVNFRWIPHYQLPPDHAYELVFFVRGTDPTTTGLGPIGWTTSTTVTVDMNGASDLLARLHGSHVWTVLLVKTSPEYRVLKSLAAGRSFQ